MDYSIETQFSEGIGSYISGYGSIFQIFSYKNISITTLDIHTSTTEHVECQVWTRKGSYIGKHDSLREWDLVFNSTIKGSGMEEPTFLPPDLFTPVHVEEGEDIGQSFYVTLDTEALLNFEFSNYTSHDTVFKSNSDLSIMVGVGVDGPAFSNNHNITSDLAWSGEIWYSYDEELNTNELNIEKETTQDFYRGLTTKFQGNYTFFGNFFDIYSFADVDVMTLDFHTDKVNESVSVAVWSKSGSFRIENGHNWTLVSNSTILGNGRFIRTSIPTENFKPVLIKERTVQSFFITLSSQSLLSSQEKMLPNQKYASNDDLWVFLGSATQEHDFDLTKSASDPLHQLVGKIGWNGIVKYKFHESKQQPTLTSTLIPSTRFQLSSTLMPTHKETILQKDQILTQQSTMQQTIKDSRLPIQDISTQTTNKNSTLPLSPTSTQLNNASSTIDMSQMNIFEFSYYLLINYPQDHAFPSEAFIPIAKKTWSYFLESYTTNLQLYNLTLIQNEDLLQDSPWCKASYLRNRFNCQMIHAKLVLVGDKKTSTAISRSALITEAKATVSSLNEESLATFTFMGPDTFQFNFILSLAGGFEEQNLDENDIYTIESSLESFMKTQFLKCDCGILISNITIDKYVFFDSLIDFRHLQQQRNRNSSSSSTSPASLSLHFSMRGELCATDSASSKAFASYNEVSQLVSTFVYTQEPTLLKDLTNYTRFRDLKHVTYPSYQQTSQNDEQNESSFFGDAFENSTFILIVVLFISICIPGVIFCELHRRHLARNLLAKRTYPPNETKRLRKSTSVQSVTSKTTITTTRRGSVTVSTRNSISSIQESSQSGRMRRVSSVEGSLSDVNNGTISQQQLNKQSRTPSLPSLIELSTQNNREKDSSTMNKQASLSQVQVSRKVRNDMIFSSVENDRRKAKARSQGGSYKQQQHGYNVGSQHAIVNIRDVQQSVPRRASLSSRNTSSRNDNASIRRNSINSKRSMRQIN